MDSLPLAFGKVSAAQFDTSRIAATKRVEAPTVKKIEDGDDDDDYSEFNEGNREAGPSRKAILSSAARGPTDDDELYDGRDDREYSSLVDAVEGPVIIDDLPVSHEIVMKDHSKTVSGLSLDPSGTRVVSGSYDYDAKLWDFSGMNSSYKPFRSWEIKEGHQIHDVKFSTTGDSFLAATGTSQAKLYNRDGIELAEYNKGDTYIRDLRHTDGHVAALTSVAWHPKTTSLFLTASADSTLRLWDVENKRKSKSVIVVKSKERGGRTKVTACAWSPDGKTIGAACEDGSLQIWSSSSNFARPNASLEGAHVKGTATSSICFSNDGRRIVTRGGDDTVKLWDARALKKPLFVAENLPSLNPETNVIFSPDEKYILTGTAGTHAGVLVGTAEEQKTLEAKMGDSGRVVVMNAEGLDVSRTLNISKYSVVKVLWHPKINQILTGSSDGSIHVLYSPLTSVKGATLAVTRAPRIRALDDFSLPNDIDRPIIAPHSLPMYKEDAGEGMGGGRGGKRQRERERHDPVKSMKPMIPLTGRGKGGRVGASATQHVVQGLVKNNMVAEDPREALLKYADGKSDTHTAMWNKNQPTPIFDMRPDDEDEDKIRAINKAKKEGRRS